MTLEELLSVLGLADTAADTPSVQTEDVDPTLGESATVGGGASWTDKDLEKFSTDLSAFAGSSAGGISDANNDGQAGVNINVMNDIRADGDNVFLVRLNDATPTTLPRLGFMQETVVLSEAPFDVPQNTYYTTDLALTPDPTYQTAIVIIRDDELPNNFIIRGNTADIVTGTAGKDTILLGGGADSASGGGDNDIMLGEAGNDTLQGQDGNDLLFGGLGNDSLVGGNNDDTLWGGVGNDRLEGNAGADVLDGEVGDDTLEGGTGSDTLNGGLGSDRLEGGTENDSLDGGAGSDVMLGGAGDDTYFVDVVGDSITELLNEGIDTVFSSVTRTLDANVENLTLGGDAAINGTGNSLNNVIIGNFANNNLLGDLGNDTLDGDGGIDQLFGGDGNDFLSGGFGEDTIFGGIGNDTLAGYSATFISSTDGDSDRLEGGAGNDFYIVEGSIDEFSSIPDFVFDTAGMDTVQSTGSWDLSVNSVGVENLILRSGTTLSNGFGNALDNQITGNEVANILSGGDGNDTLYGVDGNDTVWGGVGNDSLYGGFGNDVINGEAGADTLYGGIGNDTMNGGNGNDTYFVDAIADSVTESFADALGGVDSVFASVSYSLAPTLIQPTQGFGVENLTLTGSANLNATGNSLNNILTGNGGNNGLVGGAGNDRLNGYGTVINDDTQFDSLTGGDGSDIFVLGNAAGAFYNESGDGYAVITDWDPRAGVADTVFDRIELAGSIGQYRLDTFRNVIGGGGIDTEIIYLPTGDRIGIIQDTINVQLNRDFIFV